MPSLLNVHLRGHHASEDDAADFVFGDRFDGDPKATCVVERVRSDRLHRCIANETSEFHRPYVWIAKRGVKATIPPMGTAFPTLGCELNRGGVANVGAISTSTRESISSNGFGGRKQTVVFGRCRDCEYRLV